MSEIRILEGTRVKVTNMAHTKSSGAAKYGRDSQPKYLGIKRQDGERVKIGEILVRQRGFKYLAGRGVRVSKDDTIFSLINGLVKFTNRRKIRFDGTVRRATVINVFPS